LPPAAADLWEERFAAYCDDPMVCTDDGSYGTPGFVTAALQRILDADKPARSRRSGLLRRCTSARPAVDAGAEEHRAIEG
jgi:hypothetical protein